MILEDLAKMHRAIFKRFEAKLYEPQYVSNAERNYVKWAMSEPISLNTFVERIDCYKRGGYYELERI